MTSQNEVILWSSQLEARAAERNVQTFQELKIPWVKFGDEVLWLDSPRGFARTSKLARDLGLIVTGTAQAVQKHRLHLVTQKGRVFQLTYPNVPVIHDKGRYLVIDLEPSRARQINQEGGPCFWVEALEENQTIYTARAARERRAAPPPRVQALLAEISRDDLEDNLKQLVSFPTRYSTSRHYQIAAEWARDQLMAQGYTVQLDSVPVGNKTSHNVVANKLGCLSEDRKLVLVTAHLDSINLTGGITASAPGADDNASGSAGLLTLAHVLKEYSGLHDLRLILFGGEEQGLLGSSQYVEDLSNRERSRISAIINMDMIASLNTPFPTVMLEGAPVSQSIIAELEDAATDFSLLTVQTSLRPFGSDHVPFIRAGLPAVLTIEGTDSANQTIHTAEDTLSRVSLDLVMEILRMNLGFIANKLGHL